MGIIFSSFNGLEGKVPELRFSSYDDSWTAEKLSDFTVRVTRKNSKNQTDLPLTISSKDGLVDQVTFFNKKVSSKDMSGYYLLQKGEFAYNKSYSNGYDFGSIKRLERYEMGALSTLYICFALTKYCSDYIRHYFDSLKWYRQIYIISAEGARNHGLLNVPTDDFFATTHYLSQSLSEQEKIAAFLSLVDARIEKQRQLVESLKKYKRGLLSVIFDRKIRFKDKNANTFPEWQNTTLSDIGNFYNGLSGKNKDDFITGNSEYVTYMNVFKNTIADENICERVNVSEFEHQNIVQYGDILFTQSSETMEEVGFSSVWISSKTPFLNSFCFGLRLKNLSFVYPQFMGYLLRSYKLRILIMRESQGATRINLSSERLKNIKFMLPCFDEQVVISDLIMKIDDYIAICEEKYSYLAKLKNGLLQQMFI